MRHWLTDNSRNSAQTLKRVGKSRWRSPHVPGQLRSGDVRRSHHVTAWLTLLLVVAGGATKEIIFAPSNYTDLAAAAEIPPKPTIAVDVQSISKGYLSGVREPQQSVIRDQTEWLELWRRHANDFNATPPTVLFDQEIVVAVFHGEKPTGGYDVTISRAERSEEELVIYYQEKAPAPGSILVQVFMQPFHMVRINRQDLKAKVSFRRES